MFFFKSRKNKLKDFLKIEDIIDLSKDNYNLFISYETLIEYIKEVPKQNKKITIAEIVEIIVEHNFSEKILNNNGKNELFSLHQSLISKGEFDIWNNELFYSQQDYTVSRECSAYITDSFLKEYNIFSRISVFDIQSYLDKDIDIDKIKIYDIKDSYFSQKLRVSDIYDTAEFLDEFTYFNCNEKVSIDKEFSKYNFKTSFEDNLKEAILNYDKIKEQIKNNTFDIYTNKSRMKKEKINIGKFVDFKSLYSEALFLNVPNFSDRYLVSLNKNEQGNSAKELHINIFDTETKNDAEKDIYQELISKIKL